MPLQLQPAFAVALQQRIRRNHDIVVDDLFGLFVPLQSVQQQAAQRRTKALRFALPVAQQTDRRDDERGPVQASGVFLDLNMGQRLQGFAQPHVVGQDARQRVLAQKLQPVQPLLLVGPQLGLHGRRQRHIRQAQGATHVLQQALQAGRAGPGNPFAQRGAGAQGLQAREFDLFAAQVQAALAHQLQQCAQPGLQGGAGQAHKARAGRVAQVHVLWQRRCRVGSSGRGAGGQRNQFRQPGQHVAALAVDLYAKRQVEPGRGLLVVPLGLHLQLQPVGALHPVVQARLQGEGKTGLAQRGVVAVGPVQPAQRVGLAAQSQLPCGRDLQAQRRQRVQRALLSRHVALEQAARAIGLDRRQGHVGLRRGPPAALASVIKADPGADQAGRVGRRRRCAAQMQAGLRQQAADDFDRLEHGG